MAKLEIKNYTILVNSIRPSDRWELTVENSNFMLNKYSGRGPTSVTIIPFNNVGDLYGEIELYLNGLNCNNYILSSINNGENPNYFEVSPLEITLYGNGTKGYVTVNSSDSNWNFSSNSSYFTLTKVNNRIEITSTSDFDFSGEEIKVYSDILKSQEYVKVKQKSYSGSDNSIFKVYPSSLLFNNKTDNKNINVITNCESGYNVGVLDSNFTMVSNVNGVISIKYNGDEANSATTTLDITSCDVTSSVTLTYTPNSSSSDKFLYFEENGNDTYNTAITCNGGSYKDVDINLTLKSTSKVNVMSKPNNVYTNIVKKDDTTYILTVKLSNGDDLDSVIKLKNNDGLYANLNLTVSGCGGKSGIYFSFDETDASITTKSLSGKNSDTFEITIYSYHKEDNTSLDFNIHTSEFDLIPNSNKKPYETSTTSTTLTFKPINDSIKGLKTIQFEDVETFKRLYLNINIDHENGFYKLYFSDGSNDMYTEYYVTYDASGSLTSEKYDDIVSLSSNTSSFDSTSNVTYTSSTTQTWLNNININNLGSIGSNSNDTRYGEVDITQDGSNKVIVLHVTQYGETNDCTECIVNSLSVSPKTLSIGNEGDSKNVTVTISDNGCCNQDFEIVNESDTSIDPMLFMNVNGGTITITNNDNYSNGTYKVIHSSDSSKFDTFTISESCDEKYDFSNSTFSFNAANMGRCDTTSVISNVIVKNYSYTSNTCEESEVSEKTLNSTDYDVTYNPSGENQTTVDRNVTITVKGKGIYSSLTASTVVTQAKGPCSCTENDSYTQLSFTAATSMSACESELSISKVSVTGTHMNSDCTTSAITKELNSSDYTVTYDPSGVNNTTSDRNVTVKLTTTSDYGSLSSSVVIKQLAGPCNHCEMLIARVVNNVAETYGESISETYLADDTNSHYLNFSIRSRYYTSDTEYEKVSFTMSSNSDWIIVNSSERTFEVIDNTTTSTRNGTITFKQDGSNGCDLECYIYITQYGLSDPCDCDTQKTINVTSATISVGDYETALTGYNIPVDVHVELSENIDCGEATARIYFNLTQNSYSAYCDVLIENGENSGIGHMSYNVSTNTAPNTNCVKSIGTGHTLTFTDTDCYKQGTFSGIEIESGSECQVESVYVMQKTSADTSTNITFPGGTTYESGVGYICCYSTKDGSKHNVSASSDKDWLTVEENNDLPYDNANYNFKFTQTENTSNESRTAIVTITQSDSNKTVKWTIVQSGKPEEECYTISCTAFTNYNKIDFEFNTITTMDGWIVIDLSGQNNTTSKTVENYCAQGQISGSVQVEDLYLYDTFVDVQYKEATDVDVDFICENGWNGSFDYSCPCEFYDASVSPKSGVTTGNNLVFNITFSRSGSCSDFYDVYRDDTNYVGSASVSSAITTNQPGKYVVKLHDCGDELTSFEVVQPKLTGLLIRNNQPGDATIQVTIGNAPTSSFTLNQGSEQEYFFEFTGNSTVNVIYQTLNWKETSNCSNCFCAINFLGTNLMYSNTNSNNVNITDEGDYKTFKAISQSSCSGSLVTYNGDYTVNLNVQYSGQSQT